MTVQCVICGESFPLNEDGEEARAKGNDPHQQLRKHIAAHGFTASVKIARTAGFLVDILAFESSDPQRWDSHLLELAKFVRSELRK